MATIGDFNIGTKHPFTLKLMATTDKPREVLANGNITMHFRPFEIRCADVLITDETEQNGALYLMIYGKWEYDGG